jgi:hypothetical protein
MHTLQLEVEDSKLGVILNIIDNLKDNIVNNYEIIDEKTEQKDFSNISELSFRKIWDNEEDSVYDKYLQI